MSKVSINNNEHNFDEHNYDVHNCPQTQAAIRNFGQGQTPPEFIQALAEVKEAALRALQDTERPWPEPVFDSVCQVLGDIRAGKLDHRFPLNLAQGGAGTSLHMNICEVLADEVGQRLGRTDLFHFLDDGARSQSTNDVVSTAAIIVIFRRLQSLERAVIDLQEALVAREQAWRGITIMGRTECQDALPMDLSQVASAWAGSAERDRWRLGKLKERIRTIPLGGTATGTGHGASPVYLFSAEQHLRRLTGLPLQRSQNLTDAVAQRDDFAEVANGFALVGTNLIKICRDLMFYTSTVVGELEHPALQWGSTAMPVKTNPVLLEYAMGLAIRAQHRAASIVHYTEEGFLQLNAFTPFMVDAFIDAGTDLERALTALSRDLLPALQVHPDRCLENMLQSRALLNLLRKDLPYEKLKSLAAHWQCGISGTKAGAQEQVHQYIDELSRLTGLDPSVLMERLAFLLAPCPGYPELQSELQAMAPQDH
ncbi:lyase family protein [Gracilinema caldarium]|uniref:Aspartate ammonia-lyase n=1 Tax=Gracilinema caldarium (strain ATCC 51460 / DSM 7334 / H1) TaxID=744872 RepID=F8F3Y9_GRAC1|nr:lyase family protein [Gracilinema caldarium]AEJ20008.1 Aspartate ammonia-lyase [Gracilinema caldarium DSM 7334]